MFVSLTFGFLITVARKTTISVINSNIHLEVLYISSRLLFVVFQLQVLPLVES